jgi:threonine synthase
MAAQLASRLLTPRPGSELKTELDPETLERLTREALDFPIPLAQLGEDLFVLELFHGPTLAFKDVGARFMARLMAHFRSRAAGPLTVLTATSGDTGGAVAHAFLGLPDVRVVVLFPDGKVTPRQERQFSTLGENVVAVAVQGDFDDCQRLAKGAFQDSDLKRRLSLTSANSINVGRLIPQAFYYFLAWAQLQHDPAWRRRPIIFSVPSGNFGNLAAGLMAKALGLPSCHFVAATNANDGVPRYLESGTFTPLPSRRTLSTAMDVGDPGNLARILHLYDGELEELRKDVTGASISDPETGEWVRRVHAEYDYILDPHTAVGFGAMRTVLERPQLPAGRSEDPDPIGVVLATAHPSKFAEVVEPILHRELPVPESLARCLGREREVVEMEPDPGALRDMLLT